MCCFDQAAIAAADFLFLRQLSSPNAPKPVANSGSAAGSGTGAKNPRISPVGKFDVWMFRYVSPFRRAATNTGMAVAAEMPKNGFPTLPGVY
jgi:hypothetical protein